VVAAARTSGGIGDEPVPQEPAPGWGTVPEPPAATVPPLDPLDTDGPEGPFDDRETPPTVVPGEVDGPPLGSRPPCLPSTAVFKAYDVRGTVPDQLDAELCRAIGAAFATFLQRVRARHHARAGGA